MDCTDCGACCLGFEIPLLPTERGWTPRELIDVQGNLKVVEGPHGRHCILFDPVSRRCTDYANRPSVCRDFEPGCRTCHTMRAWVGIAETEHPAQPHEPYASYVGRRKERRRQTLREVLAAGH